LVINHPKPTQGPRCTFSDNVFSVEYTTTGPTTPTVDGADEAPTEESPLPTGAGDAEVDDYIDDENLDADYDDDTPLRFHSMSDILTTPGLRRMHWWLRNCTR
jgi:hypothetical protein